MTLLWGGTRNSNHDISCHLLWTVAGHWIYIGRFCSRFTGNFSQGLRLQGVKYQDHSRGTNQWQGGTSTQGLTFCSVLFVLSLSIATCPHRGPTWKE